MWSFFSRDSSKDFPYDIGEPVGGFDSYSIWTLHKAKRKTTLEEVSVFVYDIRSGSDTKCELAKASLKRLKTLRHPSILQYLDSLETDKMLYVATEAVEPLGSYFTKLATDNVQKGLYLAWGIFQITVSSSLPLDSGHILNNRPICSSVLCPSSTTMAICGTIMFLPGRCSSMPPENGSWAAWSMYQRQMVIRCLQPRFL